MLFYYYLLFTHAIWLCINSIAAPPAVPRSRNRWEGTKNIIPCSQSLTLAEFLDSYSGVRVATWAEELEIWAWNKPKLWPRWIIFLSFLSAVSRGFNCSGFVENRGHVVDDGMKHSPDLREATHRRGKQPTHIPFECRINRLC